MREFVLMVVVVVLMVGCATAEKNIAVVKSEKCQAVCEPEKSLEECEKKDPVGCTAIRIEQWKEEKNGKPCGSNPAAADFMKSRMGTQPSLGSIQRSKK